MARPPDSLTLKQQALLALDQSRIDLSGGWDQARDQWSPRNIIQHSVEKHRLAVIAAAAVAGFITVRWIFSSGVNGRDHAKSFPAKKRSFSSLLLNGAWGMLREPLLGIASQQLLPVVLNFLAKIQSPSKPDHPE